MGTKPKAAALATLEGATPKGWTSGARYRGDMAREEDPPLEAPPSAAVLADSEEGHREGEVRAAAEADAEKEEDRGWGVEPESRQGVWTRDDALPAIPVGDGGLPGVEDRGGGGLVGDGTEDALGPWTSDLDRLGEPTAAPSSSWSQSHGGGDGGGGSSSSAGGFIGSIGKSKGSGGRGQPAAATPSTTPPRPTPGLGGKGERLDAPWGGSASADGYDDRANLPGERGGSAGSDWRSPDRGRRPVNGGSPAPGESSEDAYGSVDALQDEVEDASGVFKAAAGHLTQQHALDLMDAMQDEGDEPMLAGLAAGDAGPTGGILRPKHKAEGVPLLLTSKASPSSSPSARPVAVPAVPAMPLRPKFAGGGGGGELRPPPPASKAAFWAAAAAAAPAATELQRGAPRPSSRAAAPPPVGSAGLLRPRLQASEPY